MKKCPYCAEEIQDEAIKCKYCHSLIDKNDKINTSKDVPVIKTKKERIKIKGGYIILIGIGFFALGKILIGVFPMDLVAEAIGVATELSLWIFLAIGIVVILRERRAKKEIENN